ncbi:MAG: SRPBCC family protein [Actinomycetota bacterium]|nr:SRPBCC family protein [Actinomycetota bacterium]
MRAEHSVSIWIDAPPQQVWDVVTHWEGQGEWMPMTRIWRTGGRANEVGEQFTARTGLGPLGFDDTITVRRMEPPHLCEVAHTGRVVRGRGEFRCVPQRSGTRFTWWEQVAVPGGPLAPVLWTLARLPLRIVFGIAMRRLKRHIEQ